VINVINMNPKVKDNCDFLNKKIFFKHSFSSMTSCKICNDIYEDNLYKQKAQVSLGFSRIYFLFFIARNFLFSESYGPSS